MKKILYLSISMLVVLAGPLSAGAQRAAQAIQFKPGMTVQSLAGHPDSEMVQLRNGKQMTLGELRRWDLAAQRMRAVQPAPKMPAFRHLPAASGTPVNNRADLLAAIKSRPGTDTLQLPSGRRITVAQLRALQPYLEQLLGRRFEDMARAPSGQPIPVNASSVDKAFWKDMLSNPANDSKLLTSPLGKQVTVGDLKQYLAQRQRAQGGSLAPIQVAPPPATGGRSGGVK
jgi:hypothetical protein